MSFLLLLLKSPTARRLAVALLHALAGEFKKRR
jgi:hypothetical protein